MLLLSYLAQKCINEYQKFSQLLLNFKLYPQDKEMILNVREYALQLMHQRLKFTCSGYMNIDLKSYGKVTLIILVYITILVQFKLSDVSEGTVRATKVIFGKF
ncbi:putative gustatory receptor 98b [Lucilia sericata]|uniref:putative gustatory receptor 98b n=1 Tax=Lucilia sericata TaxID=13632 RepID=UPI0018A83F8F|nr:putative gustatory receptor 98b [Lucilia sericata]